MRFNLFNLLALTLLNSIIIISGQAKRRNEPIESPPYSVIRQEQGYEERLYPASTWVRTRIRHANRNEATSLAFTKLFDYINGSNLATEKIPMTAPVTMLAEPASGQDCTRTFIMSFYVPQSMASKAPNPLNPDVFIEELPEVRVLVRTFGDFINKRVLEEEKAAMISSLTEADLLSVDEGGAFYTAVYDPPLELKNRRNEIWLIQMEPNLVTEMKRDRKPCVKYN